MQSVLLVAKNASHWRLVSSAWMAIHCKVTSNARHSAVMDSTRSQVASATVVKNATSHAALATAEKMTIALLVIRTL